MLREVAELTGLSVQGHRGQPLSGGHGSVSPKKASGHPNMCMTDAGSLMAIRLSTETFLESRCALRLDVRPQQGVDADVIRRLAAVAVQPAGHHSDQLVPDENWINATSSGETSTSTESVFPRLDAVTQPRRGAEISTATPRNRRMRWSVTTTIASTAWSMAAVLRRYSSSRPSRTGGYIGTGMAPAHSTPKKHSTNSAPSASVASVQPT
jgi:hypothetical protein